MSFFGGMAQAAPRPIGGAMTPSKGDMLGRRYQAFANPFFDIAGTYLPPTVKALFGFCKYYHLGHGVINAINSKAAEYPITELLLTHAESGVLQKWETLMHGVLDYRTFQLEANLSFFVLGNAFCSPGLPFSKVLTCTPCGAHHDALKSRALWRYDQNGFWLSCSKCGQTEYAKARDDYYPRVNDAKIVQWNPEQVQLFHNETTNHVDHSLDFSQEFKNYVAMGRKDLVATTPQGVLEAIRTNRALVFDSQKIYHMRRPTLSSMGRWGVPLMMPVLKDAFAMQVMKKANEAICLQHLTPQTFIFPQPATGGADPFSVASLANWRDHLNREMSRQRMDPAYVGIVPFPIGHQTIGEYGKQLLLMPEIQTMAEHICVGMGFPPDLIFGNGTYAGSSVNMRMLENFFLSNVHAHKRLIHWVMRHFGTYFGWPVPDARFKAFRMADDLQRQALLYQAAKDGMVSETAFLSQADLKTEDEAELSLAELKIKSPAMRAKAALMADIQGEQALVMAKYQARSQAAGQSAMALEMVSRKSPFEEQVGSGLQRPPGFTLDAAAGALAKEIERMPPDRAALYLQQLRAQVPEMAQLIEQQQGAGLPPQPQEGAPGLPEAPQPQTTPQGVPGAPFVDSRMLPEALPPRRPGT